MREMPTVLPLLPQHSLNWTALRYSAGQVPESRRAILPPRRQRHAAQRHDQRDDLPRAERFSQHDPGPDDPDQGRDQHGRRG